MCDYSLHSVPNRLAKEGEELIVHRFPTGSIGMASPNEARPPAPPSHRKKGFWATLRDFFNPPNSPAVCAICIPPGARLLLRDIPEALQQNAGVGPEEEVTFTELTASAFTYRDAVRFWNGREVRLQALREGQRARVLRLGSDEGRDFEAELNRRRARMEQLV